MTYFQFLRSVHPNVYHTDRTLIPHSAMTDDAGLIIAAWFVVDRDLKAFRFEPQECPQPQESDDPLDEFHPHRNDDLSRYDLDPKSRLRIWWLCAAGHEYRRTYRQRVVNGDGCGRCADRLRRTASREGVMRGEDPAVEPRTEVPAVR